jgi:hypothetical protein
MKFRIVFWDVLVLPCKIIVDRRFRGMMEAVRTSETSVDNYFTRQYIPEDNSELVTNQNYIHEKFKSDQVLGMLSSLQFRIYCLPIYLEVQYYGD